MTNLSIDLPDQLAEQLTTLSAETGRSAADMIAEALDEYLGDLEDLAIAERRRAEFLAARRPDGIRSMRWSARLAWTTRFTDRAADRDLAKLDKPVAKRITATCGASVDNAGDPRAVGEPLHGDRLGSFWKYRVGDYRVIAEIEDQQVRVLVIRVGHRSRVYRR
jgi:mRNA interferase RelE/StbE